MVKVRDTSSDIKWVTGCNFQKKCGLVCEVFLFVHCSKLIQEVNVKF